MKKFTKNLIAGAVLSTALITGAAQAEQKIAVVDVQQVFAAMPQAASIQQTIQEEFKDQIQAVNAQREELNFLSQKLQRESATMSEDEQKKLQEQILALGEDYQAKAQPLQQNIQRRQGEERNKVLGVIKQAIDSVAAKQKYDIVLEAKAVAFANQEFDISTQVLEQASKSN